MGDAQGDWERTGLGYSTRWVKERMPRDTARSRYGMTLKTADAGQRAARMADNFMKGTGRYSRRLRSYGRRMYKKRPAYRRYGGRGLYTGKGGFWSDAWNASSGLRGFLGGAARASSNPILSGLGRAAGALGIGAYETQGIPVSNEIVDGGQGNPAPVFATGGREMGTIVLSHKEYVADIFGPETRGVFQNQTFGLNPGLPSTFPWLSQIAQNYEEYTIKQLIFTFRSTITDFVATNGQVGTILLATQYNANDEPFQTKQDMMEYSGAVSAKCSQAVIAGVECDPAQLSGPPGKYTRAGPVPQNEDVKTYDLGTLNVATSNTPQEFNNQAVGELWVSYTVELRKPKFFVTRAQGLLTDLFVGAAATDDPGGANMSLSEIGWATGQQNRIGCRLTKYSPVDGLPSNGAIWLVFPQSFTGDVEVTLDILPQDGVSDNASAYAPSSGSPGIVPINDIYQGVATAPVWTNNIWSSTNTNTLTEEPWSVVKSHWRIISPTSAAQTTDNWIVFGTRPGGYGQPRCQSAMLKVSMYNTGLNYATSKHPVLADPVTGEVLNFPTGLAPLTT